MKSLLILLALSTSAFMQAQSVYVGGGATLLTGIALNDPRLETVFAPSLHLGVAVADDYGARLSFDSDLESVLIGLDALYLFRPFDPATTAYLGGGLDLVIAPGFGRTLVVPSFHGTLGLEHRLESIGLFLEVQPNIVPLFFDTVVATTRAGVNLHF